MAMNNRLLRPRASGFDPRRIANCTAWFDADKALTLNGTTVSSWKNLVAGGTDFTQATAIDQPGTTTLAGRRAVNFSGIAVHLLGPTIAAVGNTSDNTLLMFFVVRYTGTTTTTRRLLSESSTSAGVFGWFPRYGDGNAYLDFAQTNARVSGAITGSTINSAPTICRLRRAGANASLHYNATQIASRTDASGALFTSTGNPLRLNGQDNNNSAAVAEIVMFSRDLSASEIAAVESGLAKKYGITL